MNVTEFLAYSGSIASLAGLLLAAAQTVRLRDLKRRTRADAWNAIGTLLSLIDNLDQPKLRQENKGVAYAYKGATDLYRHLLKMAILEESSFNEETIKRWRSTGKLASNWQVLQARRLLETRHIKPSRDNHHAKSDQG